MAVSWSLASATTLHVDYSELFLLDSICLPLIVVYIRALFKFTSLIQALRLLAFGHDFQILAK